MTPSSGDSEPALRRYLGAEFAFDSADQGEVIQAIAAAAIAAATQVWGSAEPHALENSQSESHYDPL